MKVAVIGSRNVKIDNIGGYIPKETTVIVSGGAIGIDTCARMFAESSDIKLVEFLPEYNKYKKSAPLKRNMKIIEYSDMVIAFWDGKSKGTKFVIENCKRLNKPINVIIVKNE